MSATAVAMDSTRLSGVCEMLRDNRSEIWTTLNGISMVPTILPNTRIRIQCIDRPLAPGELVAYQDGSRLLVHRLLAITGDGADKRYILRGDGNYINDPPVLESQLLGVVTAIDPMPLGYRMSYAAHHARQHVRFITRSLGERGTARPKTIRATETNEERFLVAVLRQWASGERVEIAASVVDWKALLKLASDHGVLSFLHTVLKDDASVPADAKRRLQAAYRANAIRNHSLATDLALLIALLAEQNIDSMAYKGPALAQSIYSDPALRYTGDLDIIVRKEHVFAARDILLAYGYAAEPKFRSHEQEIKYLETDCEYGFWRTADRLNVELHWRFRPAFFAFPIDVDAVRSRRVPVPLAGRDIDTLSLEDYLLILCVHGAKHRWDRLRWICDIAAIVGKSDAIDWNRVLEQARAHGCERVLLLGLYLAHDVMGASLPPVVMSRVGPAVCALSRSVQTQMFRPTPGLRGGVQRVLFHLQLRERAGDVGRHVVGRVLWSVFERARKSPAAR